MFGYKKKARQEVIERLENASIPKLDSIRECPKCGYAEEEEDFGIVYAGWACKYVGWEIVSGGPERMRRTCPRCDWRWYERTFEDSQDD